MNKRKIMLVASALLMVAILGFGGTLAYLIDTDNAQNVFKVGNVDILLHEKNNDGDVDEAYQEWLNQQVLMPGDKENNTIAKNVYVENTGSEPAYIWVEIGVPVELDNITDASQNSLHFNYDTDYTQGIWMKYLKTEGGYNWYVMADKDGVPVASGANSDTFMYQVYMDKRVSSCENATHDGVCHVLVDGNTHYSGSWDLKINAVAFQAAGFTVKEALAEYYTEWDSINWSEWQ